MNILIVLVLLSGSVWSHEDHHQQQPAPVVSALFVAFSAGEGARLMTEAARLLASTLEFNCSLILVGSACLSNDIPISKPGFQVILIQANTSSGEEECSEDEGPLPQCAVTEHLAACLALARSTALIERVRSAPPRLLFFPGFLHDACVLSSLAGEHTAAVAWSSGHVSSSWLGHATNLAPFSTHHAPLQPRAHSLLARVAAAWTWGSFTGQMEMRYWRPAVEIVAKQLEISQRSSDQAYRGVALLMSASHPLLERPVASLPGRITVGCFQCRHARPLPEELQEWVVPRRGGLVTVLLPPSAPLAALLAALARETPHLALLWLGAASPHLELTFPANLVHHPSCDEQDALGHARARLVVCECSETQVLAAVFHGVPLLCLPRNFDQRETAVRVRQLGIGLTVAPLQEDVVGAVKAITSNASYRHAARHLGVMVRDEPETAADRLVFWSGHVARHWGHGHEEALLATRQAPRDFKGLFDVGLVLGVPAGLLLALLGRWMWHRAQQLRRRGTPPRTKAD